MNENYHNIFVENFLKNYDAAEKRKIVLTREDQILIERKSKKLEPIREFLSEFARQGVVVRHKDFYNNEIVDKSQVQNKKFNYYDAETSHSWAPGISIMFDHPAEVEIAIPNDSEDGLLVIKVATYHPYSRLLDRKFNTMEDACRALAAFICESTTSVESEYKKMLTEYDRRNKINAPEQRLEDKKPHVKAFTQTTDRKSGNSHILAKLPYPDKEDKEQQS